MISNTRFIHIDQQSCWLTKTAESGFFILKDGEKINMNNIYKNRDFYLSSFLIASGCSLKGSSQSRGITTFEFIDDENTQDLVTKYYSMNALIEPLGFVSAIRTLKSLVHAPDKNKKEINNNGTTIR